MLSIRLSHFHKPATYVGVQAQRLYELVNEAAGLRRGDVLLDLFCGTGTIGLYLAAKARDAAGSSSGSSENSSGSSGNSSSSRASSETSSCSAGSGSTRSSGSRGSAPVCVVGIDSCEAAVRDARANAELNGLVADAHFVCADLAGGGSLPLLAGREELPHVDVVVTGVYGSWWVGGFAEG